MSSPETVYHACEPVDGRADHGGRHPDDQRPAELGQVGAAKCLTAHNTASGGYTLKVMTVVAIILLPFVLAYQSWTYYVFRKRVSSNDYQQSATPAPAWRRLAPGDPGRPNR